MADLYAVLKQYGVMKEPAQEEILLAEITEQIRNNPSYLTPANFGEFVMSGNYRKVALPAITKQEEFDDKMLIITGCGRSGTTLCHKLVTSGKPSFKLNEPRELYLSLMGEQFDIWSVQSKSRSGTLQPEIAYTS